MLNRSRLSPVSKKRRDTWADYDRARQAAFNRDKGQCQARDLLPEIECWGRPDPHHLAPCGTNPELIADVANLKVLCRRHHQFVHDNPLVAREKGLLR